MTVEIKVDLEGWKSDLGELKADLKSFREEIEVDLKVKGKGDLAAAKTAANDLDGKKVKVDLDVDRDALKDLDDLDLDVGNVDLTGLEDLENVEIGAELDDDFKQFLDEDEVIHRTVRYSSTGGHPPGARSATLRWDSKLDKVDFTHMLARAKLMARRSGLTTINFDIDEETRNLLSSFTEDGGDYRTYTTSHTKNYSSSYSRGDARRRMEKFHEELQDAGLLDDTRLRIAPHLDTRELADDYVELLFELEAMEPELDVKVNLKKNKDWDSQFFNILEDLAVISDWQERDGSVDVDFRGTSSEIADAIESTGGTGGIATDGDGRPLVRDSADGEFRGWTPEDMKWSGSSGMGFVAEGEQRNRLEREMDRIGVTANLDRDSVRREDIRRPDGTFFSNEERQRKFVELSRNMQRPEPGDYDRDRSAAFPVDIDFASNTIDPEKEWLNSRGGPRTRGLWNAIMPDDFQWPGTGFRDKDGGGFFSKLFGGGGISMPNMRGFKKSLFDTDAFREAAEGAGTLGSKMKMLIPSMHKWYALLALAIPLLITMAVHALGAASALVALAGAGAAVAGLGMLGFGDNLNESLAEAKERLGDFKDDLYGVFKPTFQSFSPFSADLLNTLPRRMAPLAGDLKGLTVFMDAFNDGLDGTIDWIGEVTRAIVAFEGPIEQLAMRFGDLLGQQIIKFFEWLVTEAYENQDMFIQLAGAVKNLLLALYSLSMLFSELLVVFKPLTGLVAWFADLLNNRVVVGIMASVLSMWAMFAVASKVAGVMATLITLGKSGIFLKIAASIWATLEPLAALAVALAKIIGLKATLLGMTVAGIALVATGLAVGAAAYNAVKPKNASADFGGGGLPAGGSGSPKYGSPGGGGGGPTIINFNGPVTRDSLPSIESKVDSALGKNNYQNPDR